MYARINVTTVDINKVVYKIRNKTTGEWSEKNSYGWTKKAGSGGTWSNLGTLKNHIRSSLFPRDQVSNKSEMRYKNLSLDEIEVVPFIDMDNQVYRIEISNFSPYNAYKYTDFQIEIK